METAEGLILKIDNHPFLSEQYSTNSDCAGDSCSKLGGTVGKYRQEGGGQGYISKHVLETHSASVIHGPIGN